jgi:hypothetical protein
VGELEGLHLSGLEARERGRGRAAFHGRAEQRSARFVPEIDHARAGDLEGHDVGVALRWLWFVEAHGGSAAVHGRGVELEDLVVVLVRAVDDARAVRLMR